MCNQRLSLAVLFLPLLYQSSGQAQTLPNYLITTVAGTGLSGYSGDGAAAVSAQLASPTGVFVNSLGSIYIADQGNNRIRLVSGRDGTISTPVGTGTAGFAGDKGNGTAADLNSPLGVVLNSAGTLYIADTGNNVVRAVTPSNIITTFAGDYSKGFSFGGDGGSPAGAVFNEPSAVALDAAGNLYIADTFNNRIRKVTIGSNTIATVAGSSSQGFSGDGGLATVAKLNKPLGVAVDAAGNIYIADTGNNCIRKVSGGQISTVAGIPQSTGGFSGDGGPATSAALSHPSGVAVDTAGNIYIADTFNSRIRVVTQGSISTIAGNGRTGYFGDGGPAKTASLFFPYGVTVAPSGNIYIADTQNNAIRELAVNLTQTTPPPSIKPSGVISASQFGGFSSTAPGSWIEIYGSNLSSKARTWTGSDFQGNAAPTALDQTSVSIGGQSAYVAFISPNQVNVEIPSNVGTGPQPITVNTPGGGSSPYSITVYPNQPELYAPPFLNIGGNQYVGALFSDGVTFVAPPGAIPGHTSRQAKPGEIITMYGIGFGPVTPNIPAGQIVQQNNALTTSLLMLFGNTPTTTQYAGLAPDLVGLYQINVVVPNVPNSDLVPLSFTLGGAANSQLLYTAVHN